MRVDWRQLQLFPWNELLDNDKNKVSREIRNEYWFLRSERAMNKAERLRHYRKVASHKKRLFMADVDKREILDFLR